MHLDIRIGLLSFWSAMITGTVVSIYFGAWQGLRCRSPRMCFLIALCVAFSIAIVSAVTVSQVLDYHYRGQQEDGMSFSIAALVFLCLINLPSTLLVASVCSILIAIRESSRLNKMREAEQVERLPSDTLCDTSLSVRNDNVGTENVSNNSSQKHDARIHQKTKNVSLRQASQEKGSNPDPNSN